MDMMDFYTTEQALEALEDITSTKEEYIKEIERLDTMTFILRYFLATGDPLRADAFNLEAPEEDSDD